MIVWCMLTISIMTSDYPIVTETAVKGKIIKKQNELYLIDFSKYAKEKKYFGNWSEFKLVEKEKCLVE